MAKLPSVGQCSRLQFLFASLLMIIASLTLTDTSHLRGIDPETLNGVRRFMCSFGRPEGKILVNSTTASLDRINYLANRYFESYLRQKYDYAMQSKPDFNAEYRVIKDVKKDPGIPVNVTVFQKMHFDQQRRELEKLYIDSYLARGVALERKMEADHLKQWESSEIFREILKETDKIQRALMQVIPIYGWKFPNITTPVPYVRTEDTSDHHMRCWAAIYDIIVFTEYTIEFSTNLVREYCSYICV